PDLERIFKLTPPRKQTLFFSATMPPEITRLTKQFLNDPVRIEASRPATTGENIAQHLVRIPSSDPKAKRMALRALAERANVKNGIVFCNRKTEVDVVAKSLRKHGFDASPIHGDLDQSLRMKTLAAFRSGELKLLVASDVAARGLDIPDVSHVFNYDVPHHADDYVHRIGRTGRAGKSGETFMIITPADAKSLDKVLKLTKSVPDEVTLDLDWSQAVSGPARGGRKDAKGGRASGRGEDRGRGRKAREEEAPSPAPMAVEAPEAETSPEPTAERPAREGRRSRGRDRDRKPREEDAVVAPALETAEAEASPDERPEREERRSRGRGRGRDRKSEASAPTEAPRVVETEERPSRDRPARSEGRPRREAESRPAREEPQERRGYGSGGSGGSSASGYGSDERRSPGFGSDTPAFLLRPAPIAAKKATADD
ncbi:MAG TPA: helicase-related protein, partial [Caulobacteraceae bacterium]|nr:helicase-related protein [Caulobacteraceae bacterium]